jgi:methionyl aminopeptidase
MINKGSFNNHAFIDLKNQKWLEKQRTAGKIVADTLNLLQTLVNEKTSKSLIELNSIAEEYIINSGATLTFKGYKGFPAGVCISVNKELVHGIPKEYKLQDGDVVSFDLGATFEGVIADSAITCIYGNPKTELHVKLINATEECLMRAIHSIEVGKRLGIIGHTISKCAKKNGFGLITKYGGHGISITDDGVGVPHAAPFVANQANINEGIRIQPGLVLAIEPMLVIGAPDTRTLNDGWTVVTNDIGAHCEHSIFIHNDHVEVLTLRNKDLFKSNKLFFKSNLGQSNENTF